LVEHECANCEKDDEPNDLCEDRTILLGFWLTGTDSLWLVTNGFALHVDGLWLTILSTPELIGQLFSHCWSRSISRQSADMYEQFCTSVCRRYEAEASIVFPGSERTCEAHSDA